MPPAGGRLGRQLLNFLQKSEAFSGAEAERRRLHFKFQTRLSRRLRLRLQAWLLPAAPASAEGSGMPSAKYCPKAAGQAVTFSIQRPIFDELPKRPRLCIMHEEGISGASRKSMRTAPHRAEAGRPLRRRGGAWEEAESRSQPRRSRSFPVSGMPPTARSTLQSGK